MKIEKEFFDYYQKRINIIQPPERPSIIINNRRNSFIQALSAASVIIALLFIPLTYRINNPPMLSLKAASFCENNEIDSRIRNGLLEIKKIASYSLITGGKK